MFINRQAELTNLEAHYHSGRAELFVLYGRRRVGKTELLRHFCANNPHLFFIATLSADQRDIFSNIRTHILDGQGTLRREPQLLLMEELREPRNYFSILRAIAQGSTRLNEISQAARVGDAVTTSRYLDILQDLRVVSRRVPATESRPDKSKRGLYQITDAFLRFWFRYVHPNQGSLDLGLADAVLAQRVRPGFDQFVSYAFEEAARGHVAHLARIGQLGFLPERIGSWWDRAGEIDVVAISDADNALLLAECKWSVNPVGTDILDDLQRKARLVDPAGRYPMVTYAIFAKAGFTPALVARATAENIRLIEPSTLIGGIL